ncbi:MAG: hypothetical protein C0459_12720 [Chitinophaga sp.]|jgi:hypothetical protein|nr:hypothetical protein [Chitinophaga sp.]
MQRLNKPFLLIVALLEWFAVSTQFYFTISNRLQPLTETLIRFFSYFTILTNLMIAIYCSVLLLKPLSKTGLFFSQQKNTTAVTVYIVIVEIIYNTVLRGLWKPEGLLRLVDELLHLIIPALFFVYWLAFTKKNFLKWKDAFAWLLYPLIYVIYILIRGNFSGFYPYPFIDMDKLGVAKTLVNAGFVTLLFLLISVMFIGLGKLINRLTK